MPERLPPLTRTRAGFDWERVSVADFTAVYAGGASLSAMARRFGCSVGAVRDQVLRLGLKLRAPTRAGAAGLAQLQATQGAPRRGP